MIISILIFGYLIFIIPSYLLNKWFFYDCFGPTAKWTLSNRMQNIILAVMPITNLSITIVFGIKWLLSTFGKAFQRQFNIDWDKEARW